MTAEAVIEALDRVATPASPYGGFGSALRADGPLQLHCGEDDPVEFEVERWHADPDAADETLLAHCTDRTLDIGCGPGRLVAALAGRGVTALGIDISPTAVRLARARGACALRRSVFGRVPGTGRWGAVLLADGNIGIGADPARLLARVATLLAPDGLALVEADPRPGRRSFHATVRDTDGRPVAAFPWARIDTDATIDLAVAAGLRVQDRWESGGRHFVALRNSGIGAI